MNIYKTNLEVKSCDDEGVFSGYASVFGNIDLHDDVIMPGAFASSIKRCGEDGCFPKLLWQHDQTMPIGIWNEIREDGYGLWVKGRIFLNIQKGREAYELVKGGVVDGLSIGFRIGKAKKMAQYRLIEKVDLQEISLVTFAANPKAKIMTCKSMELGKSYVDRLVKKLEELKGIFSGSEVRGVFC